MLTPLLARTAYFPTLRKIRNRLLTILYNGIIKTFLTATKRVIAAFALGSEGVGGTDAWFGGGDVVGDDCGYTVSFLFVKAKELR